MTYVFVKNIKCLTLNDLCIYDVYDFNKNTHANIKLGTRLGTYINF